jgi:hypothetical protein
LRNGKWHQRTVCQPHDRLSQLLPILSRKYAKYKGHEEMEPGNRKRLGEFLILLIYLLIEGFGIWPFSHFWCLTTTVAGIVALLFLDGGFTERQIGIAAAVMVIICSIIYLRAPPILPEETVHRGLLVSANDPTPSTGCDPAGNPRDTPNTFLRIGPFGFGTRAMRRPTIVVPKDAAIVVVGSNGVILSTSDKVPLIRVGECTLLSMQKTEDGVLINSSVYDRSNKLIGNIKDNNFQGIDNVHSDIKQEGDLSTLIIREDSGVRLWVRFLNPRAVKVRGEFICPQTSATIVINDRSLTVVGHKAPAVPLVMENQCFQNGILTIPEPTPN